MDLKIGDKVGRGMEQGIVDCFVETKVKDAEGFAVMVKSTRIKWNDGHCFDYAEGQAEELKVFKIG